jgi:hypothetical protein
VRNVAAVLALALGVALVLAARPSSAVPAPAAPASWHVVADPVADGRVHRSNDIIRIRIGNLPYVKLRVDTRAGTDPWSNPAWRNADGGTRIVWWLNTDLDAAADYRVHVNSTPDGPSVPLVTDLATGTVTCAPAFNVLDGNRYLLMFGWGCIGSPGRFSAQVRYRFQPPTGAASTDVAPNGRMTPKVTYPVPI